MSIFKSENPALSDKIFQKAQTIYTSDSNTMSAKGTLQKFAFLFLMVMGSALFTWKLYYEGVSVTALMWGGVIVGMILALIMAFKPQLSKYLAPAYALAEGFFLGALSATINFYFEERYPNIVLNAVGLTFGVVLAMYFLYTFRIIKVTEQLKSIIIIATVGIGIFYLISMVLGMFGVHISILSAENGSMFSIIFSLVVVAIAALNLLLDFDRIEQLSFQGTPKYMEWYCAFGLLVTIVWLYIEILKLLMKLANRKD